MSAAAQYLKIVEWSEEDQCFVGRCPGLIFGGVHGDDEREVYNELCEVAEEWVSIAEEDGLPLPEPTAGKEYSGNFVLRVDRELHKVLSLRAKVEGLSLNSYCERLLGSSVSPGGFRKAAKVSAETGRKEARASRAAASGLTTKKAAKRKAANKHAAKRGRK